MPVTCGDLFCGCGGFTEGMKQAGINVLFGIDNDKEALLTYAINQPGTWCILGDIRKIPIELIHTLCPDQKINLIVGGPPCQGFSRSNMHKKKDDPRNTLWREYFRFVDGLKPDNFIMENVPELAKMKDETGGLIIDDIYRTAKASRYTVEHKILNAADYGVPQFRRRIFVIGSHCSQKNPYKWPEPTHFDPKKLSKEELDRAKEEQVEDDEEEITNSDKLISHIWMIGGIIAGDKIGNLKCTFSTNPDTLAGMQIPEYNGDDNPAEWDWIAEMLGLCMDMGEIAAINPLAGRYYSFTNEVDNGIS
jgi:DNA-cytosine methyltransferase